jgi:hypothetical protein
MAYLFQTHKNLSMLIWSVSRKDAKAYVYGSGHRKAVYKGKIETPSTFYGICGITETYRKKNLENYPVDLSD